MGSVAQELKLKSPIGLPEAIAGVGSIVLGEFRVSGWKLVLGFESFILPVIPFQEIPIELEVPPE